MHYHVIGIAGAGMSAIAQVLLDQGHQVSGADPSSNAQTDALVARGARIVRGHAADNVQGADRVLTTSAARPDHVELRAARAAGIPVLKRDDLWREWSLQRPIVAVAGSAGKTTTTALIAFLLSKAGLNPGFLVGGIVPDLGASGRWGDPAAPLVIEADEYDRAFLALQPWLAVVTNVEWDHVDIYPTFTKYLAAFGQFAAQSETLIADPETWPGLRELPRSGSLITYGGSGCDWQVGAARVEHGRTYASARFTGEPALDIRFGMHLHGSHNVRNATAALVVAQRLGLNMAEATLALLEFRGTGRRFELKGERRGITVIDDYAHHPAKVRATLEAARMLYGQRRIVVYMQPHTFSRTRALLDDWPAALAGGDEVLIGDIYGAREELSAGDPVSGAILAERVARSHPRARYVGDLAGAAAAALALLRPGDVLLTLGAGDGYLVGEQVLREL